MVTKDSLPLFVSGKMEYGKTTAFFIEARTVVNAFAVAHNRARPSHKAIRILCARIVEKWVKGHYGVLLL